MASLSDLRIIYMGTPEFAIAPLEALLKAGATIIAVITAPDKPAGRKMELKASAIKEYALSKGLKVLQPEKLKKPEFLAELAALKADLQVVVAFRMLPEVVWNMPPMGTINLHASLLPMYRGAAPINWAIINGETVTGVSTFFLRHEIDTGPLIFQERLPIEADESFGELYQRLSTLGASLMVRTCQAIAEGTAPSLAQEVLHELTPAPKIFREHGAIDWAQTAQNVHNLIRGLSPVPAAWGEVVLPDNNNATIKVFQSALHHDAVTPSTPGRLALTQHRKLLVHCGDGALELLDLQAEGKKRMTAKDFANGLKWQ